MQKRGNRRAVVLHDGIPAVRIFQNDIPYIAPDRPFIDAVRQRIGQDAQPRRQRTLSGTVPGKGKAQKIGKLRFTREQRGAVSRQSVRLGFRCSFGGTLVYRRRCGIRFPHVRCVLCRLSRCPERLGQNAGGFPGCLLDARGIEYEAVEHPPVCSVEEADALAKLPFAEHEAKNFFLRDPKHREYYLVTVPDHKKVDLKRVQAELGSKRLSFASADDLAEKIGI